MDRRIFSLLQLASLVACGLLVVACAQDKSSRRATSAVVTKPHIVTTQEWGSNPQPIPDSRKHTPQWVTIHHAGVVWTGKTNPADFVRNMQAWGQRDKHWPDLPYHFLIAPDGEIYEGRQLQYEPESNTRYDLQGNIGVEMMGSFGVQRPSPQQLQSCVKLVAWLCHDLHIGVDHVRGHKDAAPNQTDCPGRDFYRYLENGQFKAWVTQTLSGQHPQVEPGPPLPDGPTTQITLEAPPATRPIGTTK